jgi:hypothetical protein
MAAEKEQYHHERISALENNKTEKGPKLREERTRGEISDILTWKCEDWTSESSDVSIDKDNSKSTNNPSKQMTEPTNDSVPLAATATENDTNTNKMHSKDEKAPKAPTTDVNNTKPVVTVASSSKTNETVPIVNVKETVQVFNQIAALREKNSTGQVGAGPLADTSSSSHTTSSAGSQQQSAAASSEFSRPPLGLNGQSYKQRSIRATLAPSGLSDSKDATPKGRKQDQSTSSSSSTKSSIDQTENGTKSVATVSASFSSKSDNNSTSDHSSRQPASSSSSTTAAANAIHQHHHHERTSQPVSAPKHATSHNCGSQSSSSGQQNHNRDQQQQALVKGKGFSGKHSSASSRLPTTNGHHNHQGASLATQAYSRSQGSPSLQQQQQQPVEQVSHT